jgi:hypothetical protein
MVSKLKPGTDTAHAASANSAERGELFCRVETPGVLTHLLPAVPLSVEFKRVQIHPATLSVAENQPGGEPWLSTLVAPEAEAPLCQCSFSQGELGKRKSEIEIVMRARLAAEESVHSPPAVEPHLDPRSVEHTENVEHVAGAHPDLFSLPCCFA